MFSLAQKNDRCVFTKSSETFLQKHTGHFALQKQYLPLPERISFQRVIGLLTRAVQIINQRWKLRLLNGLLHQ